MIAHLSILPGLSSQGKCKRVDDKDIFKLFSSLAEGTARADHAVRDVFAKLIRTTLNYRDHLLESCNVIVTVADVRTALDQLIPTLKTGKLPEMENKIQLDLLKLWLDEFKKMV